MARYTIGHSTHSNRTVVFPTSPYLLTIPLCMPYLLVSLKVAPLPRRDRLALTVIRIEKSIGARMSASPNRAEFSGTTDLEVQVTVVSEDEGKPSQQRPQQLRANVKYGSPWKVLCSPFVLGQVAFNALSSVGCSVLLFYFLFVVLVVPPGDPLLVYHWTDPNLVGVVIGSALIVSPTLVMILAPAGMPEAVRNANVARVLDTHWAFLLALLSLASSPHSCARIPMLRRSTRAGFSSFG